MESNLIFGTYNVPSINVNLSATYTSPSILPLEVMEKIIQAEESDGPKEDKVESDFDKTLGGVLSVPKPKK